MTRYDDFDSLGRADLVLDCVYAGGAAKNIGAEPLAKLLRVGNQGGFRYYGSPNLGECRCVVLFTTGFESDWPDHLDTLTGRFTYFGDNRTPGHRLHETRRGGNELLRQVFEALHDRPSRRGQIPPFFVFERAGTGRDVQFRGIAVPGAPGVAPLDDLVAVWKSNGGERFQNYRATFTVLDCDFVSRSWLDAVFAGSPHRSDAPRAWSDWVTGGPYRPLQAERSKSFRLPGEQLPTDEAGKLMLEATYLHFRETPHRFEHCAAALWQMVAPSATVSKITRPSRDGGMDAVGNYSLGPRVDPVQLSYALEAKCYAPTHGATVRDTSRLISRLKHREFGVFVTTSYVGQQAYEEIRSDAHPVVIMSGRDIVEVLKSRVGSVGEAREWLGRNFPAG